ncbi:MAG: hypothetical protein KC777_17260 [Cyanobacteria bacterium HKST-UBA02]|nr:hypothetical protein [Cyanobacteria bacterium HKST-UBA02]
MANLKLEMLKMTGQVSKVLLMPELFGGDDKNKLNVIWLYKSAAKQKDEFDRQLQALIQESGIEWSYRAEPEYGDDSEMPECLKLQAISRNGQKLTQTIANSSSAGAVTVAEFSEGHESEALFLPSPKFVDLYHQHIAASFDKHVQLEELLGDDWSWNLDMSTALLTLTIKGDTLDIPFQVLGSESHVSGTWLWSWANQASNLPEKVLDAALKLRAQGEDQEIPELTEASLPLEAVSGHMLSLVARGICGADAFFCGPYENGGVFLLLTDFPQLPVPENPAVRMTSIFPLLVSNVPVDNHRAAFEGYAKYYGFVTEQDQSEVVARHEKFGELVAEFDEMNRMTSLDARLQPTG